MHLIKLISDFSEHRTMRHWQQEITVHVIFVPQLFLLLYQNALIAELKITHFKQHFRDKYINLLNAVGELR